nr:hypothetical protein F22D6.13 - Caenorhabditis elegans [Caenorhabditis elegans]
MQVNFSTFLDNFFAMQVCGEMTRIDVKFAISPHFSTSTHTVVGDVVGGKSRRDPLCRFTRI